MNPTFKLGGVISIFIRLVEKPKMIREYVFNGIDAKNGYFEIQHLKEKRGEVSFTKKFGIPHVNIIINYTVKLLIGKTGEER